MKISKVKVAVFRVVDQYTHEDKFIIASMFPASKPITEVKSTFNNILPVILHTSLSTKNQGHSPLRWRRR